MEEIFSSPFGQQKVGTAFLMLLMGRKMCANAYFYNFKQGAGHCGPGCWLWPPASLGTGSFGSSRRRPCDVRLGEPKRETGRRRATGLSGRSCGPCGQPAATTATTTTTTRANLLAPTRCPALVLLPDACARPSSAPTNQPDAPSPQEGSSPYL